MLPDNSTVPQQLAHTSASSQAREPCKTSQWLIISTSCQACRAIPPAIPTATADGEIKPSKPSWETWGVPSNVLYHELHQLPQNSRIQGHNLTLSNFLKFLLRLTSLPPLSQSWTILFPHVAAQDTTATWILAQGNSWQTLTTPCQAKGSCPSLEASLVGAHRETCLQVAR